MISSRKMLTLRRHADKFHWWLKVGRNQWSFLIMQNHDRRWLATTDIVTTRQMKAEAA